MLRSKGKEEESKTKREQAGRVTEVFKTPEFEAWLKGRYKGGGAMDMSVRRAFWLQSGDSPIYPLMISR
jgi:hypothetical protein